MGYGGCGRKDHGNEFVIIVVLFILLIIVGTQFIKHDYC
ncbi:YjcZ family sporulation protein [Rummeliibacillus pycnus]